jgi:hypothetical protein
MTNVSEGMQFTVSNNTHNKPYLIEAILTDRVRVSWDHGYGYSRAHYSMNTIQEYFTQGYWVLLSKVTPDIDWDIN